MSGTAILLSIRPQYADRIFEGTKTVELRRVRPRYVRKGTLALIYVSSPIKALVGAFKVGRVIEEPLQDLWQIVHDKAGITREEFEVYYDGVSRGVGIFISEVWHLPEPIELQDLGLHPPQGFRYATTSELATPQIAEFVEDKIIVQSSFLDSKMGVDTTQ
jgi:predicted transcriptional regulator